MSVLVGDRVACHRPGADLHGKVGRVELLYDDGRVGVTWSWGDGETYFVAVSRRHLRRAKGGRR